MTVEPQSFDRRSRWRPRRQAAEAGDIAASSRIRLLYISFSIGRSGKRAWLMHI